jgi:pilus assembly protein Flp/PilA
VLRIIRHFLRDVKGATAIEYGLIAALVSVGVAGFIQPLSDLVVTMYTMAADAVTDASPDP